MTINKKSSEHTGKIEWIKVSAVVYSTEDREKVALAMATLFPFDFEILRSKAKGHYGNPIEYLEVEIKKKREIKEFWKHLIEMLESQAKELIATVDDRLDNQSILHIRLDKQMAYVGEVKLGSGEGDAIVVKVKLVTYPSKREKVIEMLKELICTTS